METEISNYSTKIDVVQDVYIRCEPRIPSWESRDNDNLVKLYSQWIKDFQDFIRDHRSQDGVDMEVVQNKLCSLCKRVWEEFDFPTDDEGPGFRGCAWCGVEIKS